MRSKDGSYLFGLPGSIRLWVLSHYNKISASDFVRKVAETLTTHIFVAFIGFITSVMVARILGAEGQGLYAIATTVSAIGVQFGNLGLHSSNMYYISREPRLLPELVGNSLLVSFLFGGAGAVAAWSIFSLAPNLVPIHGTLLILALGWIPFGLACLLLQNLLLGMQEVRAYNKVELVKKILGVCFIGCILLFGWVTVENVFLATLLGLVISFGFVLWRLKFLLTQIPLPSFDVFKSNIGFGIKAYASDFFAFMVLRVDILFVNYYLGTKDAGLYAVAVGMINLINMFPVVVGSLFFPKLCAVNEWKDRFRLVRKVCIVMAIIMIPVTMTAMLVADILFATVFGHSFANSAIPFRWLLPGALLLSVEVMLRRILISDEYRIEVVWSWLITLTVNIILNFYLIPRMGIKGAACASSASFVLLTAMTILLLRRFVAKSIVRGLI